MISISDISTCSGICLSLHGCAQVSGRNGGQFTQLNEARSVSETWILTSRAYGGRPITFDWFVLALSWLYAVNAIDYDSWGLITRSAQP
ncbi:ABC-three component system middle component 6 [Amaricoccus sp. W119]|uniref:ABC-three component system middle component 6 n=1 Tax=Amaricoccus sp. W119 TaxID=3391833 RepID=UPI0039A5774D